MPEFSHEDIKNAILHAGEEPIAEAPHVDIPADIEVPHTVHEGFETKPPEPHERHQFDQDRAAVRDRYRRTPDASIDTVPARLPAGNRRKRIVAATIAGALLSGGIAAGVGILTSGKDKTPTEHAPSDPTTSATPNNQPTATPTEKAVVPADFELKVTDPEEVPTAVGEVYTKYMNEADDATSETMLQGLFGNNLTTPATQKLVSVLREHRQEIQHLFANAKTLGDKAYCKTTIDVAGTVNQNEAGAYTMPVILIEDTNFDDLYRNPNYDYTVNATLTATKDGNTFHLSSIDEN